jgi:mRNA-degrading endonuclease toxin of MazEF toxin-antitoxin module
LGNGSKATFMMISGELKARENSEAAALAKRGLGKTRTRARRVRQSVKLALVTVVSHTTSLRGSEFEISVPVPFLKLGAFMVQSLTTIPTRWALRRLGQLATEQLVPVEDGVRRWLGL